jgi:hypothetical protein
MITLFLSYHNTQLARITVMAVPSVGDQVSHEDETYYVVGRCFIYENGFTSVVCVVEKGKP